MSFFRGRFLSFGYAILGIGTLVSSQVNAQLHLAATVGALLLGVWLKLTAVEWCVMSGTIVLVWVAEGLNTAVEFMADAAVPERHPLIKKAKDVAAGAVLLAAVNAVVIGGVLACAHR